MKHWKVYYPVHNYEIVLEKYNKNAEIRYNDFKILLEKEKQMIKRKTRD